MSKPWLRCNHTVLLSKLTFSHKFSRSTKASLWQVPPCKVSLWVAEILKDSSLKYWMRKHRNAFLYTFFKISCSINFSCSFISQRIAIFLFTNRRELFLEKCGGKSDRIHTQSSLKYPKVRYAFAKILATEAATQRCFQEKMFWKYAANLQENSYAEVWFQ